MFSDFTVVLTVIQIEPISNFLYSSALKLLAVLSLPPQKVLGQATFLSSTSSNNHRKDPTCHVHGSEFLLYSIREMSVPLEKPFSMNPLLCETDSQNDVFPIIAIITCSRARINGYLPHISTSTITVTLYLACLSGQSEEHCKNVKNRTKFTVCALLQYNSDPYLPI